MGILFSHLNLGKENPLVLVIKLHSPWKFYTQSLLEVIIIGLYTFKSIKLHITYSGQVNYLAF